VASGIVSGTTESGARVYLYSTGSAEPKDTAGYRDSIQADTDGRYSFSDVPADAYNLFVYPDDPALGLVIQDIPVETGTVHHDTATFDTTVGISGTVVYLTGPAPAVVGIVGSPLWTNTDAGTGSYALDRVPVASYPYEIIGALLVRSNTYGLPSDSQTIITQSDATKQIIVVDLDLK
jgi:hypothetical protein